MKPYKHIVLACLTALILNSSLKGQAINRDSSRAVGMRNMQKILNLTNEQVNAITELTIQQEKKVQSMKGVNVNPEQREKLMAENHDQYRKKVKKILTKVQWEQYTQIETQRRSKLIQEAEKNKRKIKLGEIKN